MADRVCPVHLEHPSIAFCESCNRGMCDECWALELEGRPYCSPCANLCRRPIAPLVPIGAGVLLLGLLLLAAKALPLAPWIQWTSFVGSALSVIIGLWRVTKRANERRLKREWKNRPPVPPKAGAVGGGHPYRGAARRMARRIAPPLSGRMAGLVVASALCVAAVIIPKTLSLSLWIEFEIIVVAWWLLLTAILAGLLFGGWRIARDEGFGVEKQPSTRSGNSKSSGWDNLDGLSGCADFEGLAIVLAVAACVLLGWLVVELVVPALVFGVYVLLLGALRRVANDHHDCEGSIGRSLGWGIYWASLYTLPLALLIYLVHVVMGIGPSAS